jgi:hypothetical protein
MTEPMFDMPVGPTHAHMGHGCSFCAGVSGPVAAVAGSTAAHDAADPDFLAAFQDLLERFRRSGRPFTSAHVLLAARRRGFDTSEARAVGTVMRRAYRKGLIRPTGRFVTSPDKAHHSGVTREWVGA